MNGCLRDHTLLRLAAGEETAMDRAHFSHLRSCLDCARRYQQLTRQLDSIERTLRETDPPVLTAPARVPRRYWAPLTAALAAAMMFVWVNVRGLSDGQRSPQTSSTQARQANVTQEDMTEQEWAEVLLATEDERPISLFASVSGETYLQAATTEGGWPCEWQEPFATPTCEIHPFPIILAMQSLEEVMYE